MTKLKFGAWIPTYAGSGGKGDPKNVKRIRASIEKCEDHGIDVWVVDHLLSAPGLYGNAWLEPLNVLGFAAALTRTVKIGTGILVLPVRHPVVLAKEISTLGQARLVATPAAREENGKELEEAHLRALQLHPPRGHGEPREGGGAVEGAVPPCHGHKSELRAPAGVLHGRKHRPHQHAH